MRYHAQINRNYLLVTLSLILAGIGWAGCHKKDSGPKQPTVLTPRDQPYVQDVPVPEGFKLDREKSDHSYTEGRRRVKHYYLGKDEPMAVRNFYVHFMPVSDWQVVDEKLASGVYTLDFRKAEERCEIRIEKIPAGWFKPSTRVRATVRTPHLESSSR